MSHQAVIDFWTRVDQKPGLQAQLAKISSMAKTEGLAAVVCIGQNAGFAFTSEELDTVLGQSAAEAPLDDDQLENVAGGGVVIVEMPDSRFLRSLVGKFNWYSR